MAINCILRLTLLLFTIGAVHGFLYNLTLATPNSPDRILSYFKPEPYDYSLKIAPYQMEKCYPQKKISESYLSTLKITETLQLSDNDSLHCDIMNAHYNMRKPILTIHTMGSTSDPSHVTKFSNPSDTKCFSFSVKTSGVATIYLYTDLNLFKYKIITIGSKNNTQAYISDNHQTCTTCKPVQANGILDAYEFRNFWISWDDDEIKVGKEGEKYFINNSFYGGVGKILYIGLSTPGTTSSYMTHSIWTVEEPFCPEVLEAPNKEKLVITKCHKVFNGRAPSFLSLSPEKQVLKKVQALSAEYKVEMLESKISLNRTEEYYYKNLDILYFGDYMQVLKICRNTGCDTTFLQMIPTEIEDFRKILKDKIEDLISKPPCSDNATLNPNSLQCECNYEYGGDGFNCGVDSDGDGFPDEDISECLDNIKCRKDNCPNTYNIDQWDSDGNGIGEACENNIKYNIDKDIEYISYLEQPKNVTTEEDPCAVLPLLPENIVGKKCRLESDFVIPNEHNKNIFELIFSQKDSNNTFRFIWNNNYFGRFELRGDLNNENESTDVVWIKPFESTNSNIWSTNSRIYFKYGRSYRFIIFYASKELQIRLIDAEGTITETKLLNIDTINDLPINELCSISGTVKWEKGVHYCY